MDNVLAYAPQVATLFRQRVTPLPLQPPSSSPFDPAVLTSHLLTDHNNGGIAAPASSEISQSIYTYQVSNGFNSDRVNGTYMAAFNPAAPLKSLSIPTIGAAWNLLEDKVTSFYLVGTPVPLNGLSPTGRSFLALNYTANFPYTQLQPASSVEFGKPDQFYRVVQPTQLNTNGTISASNLTNNGWVQTKPNVYEIELKNTPNMGRVDVYLSSSDTTKVRQFILTGNLFPAGGQGFFKEAEFAVEPSVQQIFTHMDTYPHYGIRDSQLSNTSCLSANEMAQRYSNYGLESGAYGGDAWLQSNGTNDAHPIEPLPSGTLVYWVALYNGSELGKKVVAPDGTVLARPVNGKRKMRCAFLLAAELTPIADEGVLLRRCNPTLGYKLLPMLP